MNDSRGKNNNKNKPKDNKIISLRNNQCTLTRRAVDVHTQSKADRQRESSTAHSALKRLHSTESCLHPHISAHIGGVQRGRNQTEEKENSWVRFLRLNASVSRVCGTVTSRWGRGHKHRISLSKSYQPTGGPSLEPKLKAAEAEAEQENTARRGRRKRADQIGKTQQLKGNWRG